MVEHTLTTEQQGTWTFRGELLGKSTTRTDIHNHPEGEYPPNRRDASAPRRKCSACRWHEAYIYADDDTDGYVLLTVGGTAVPGEIPFKRMTRSSTPMELMATMVVRTASPYIPISSERALAQAADADDDIREAYTQMRAARHA